MTQKDFFKARDTFDTGSGQATLYRLSALGNVERLPFSIKIMLESVLRNCDGYIVTEEDVKTLANYNAKSPASVEIPFKLTRVVMQDFTGVPGVVDLAAMRAAAKRLGGDPEKINPLIPVDLVIDHSVQVDYFNQANALQLNSEVEFERNRERYEFLRWGQQAFSNFRVVPPATGIIHQVNLEYLAKVVALRDGVAMPDTLVGTDSHTTMINGVGVVGWGVGGIEAEAVMLGQPLYILTPKVVGMKLTGLLREGVTATDLALTVTQILRKHGVVEKFVEFYGAGLSQISLADRATIANMAPEYGATLGYFPIDAETLNYLRRTGHIEAEVLLVERYAKEQGLFRTDATPDPDFSETLKLNLADVVPSLAGPKRPQDRVPLTEMKQSFESALVAPVEERGFGLAEEDLSKKSAVKHNGSSAEIGHGAVVIASITSCTNTSNPAVLLAAGLVAKKAVERGLKPPTYVKTSLAPGSKVVTEYLNEAGLLSYLEQIGFGVVAYGCTTCLAKGTPVLQANGTARRIEQMQRKGGALVFGPTPDGRLGMAMQSEMMIQGVRDCVALTLQDGRTLVCTPDHEILCSDGRWKRADQLCLGQDRVVIGLEVPVDEPGSDEADYVLQADSLRFTLDTPQERLRMLAFARLLGHLLHDGSISVAGQSRMNVGQAVDREVVLSDILLVTGRRPAASRYDTRKWSIVLPRELTVAILALPGVRAGKRIHQSATLPAFVLEEDCPVAIVREFLGGLFGADGHAPILHRQSVCEEDAVLVPPAYSQSALPQHVGQVREMIDDILRLLARCGVKTDGARVYEYPTRRSASSYPAGADGVPRVEVRLSLPDGLSFVECVGFRYCVDKALRASAAAAYWRLVTRINDQRLWMSARLTDYHREEPLLSFVEVRQRAAVELGQREVVVFPHYSLLEGSDRFSRLPLPTDRSFRPLHRDSCDFPSPVELFRQMGVREWFAPLESRTETDYAKRYCMDKEDLTLPAFTLAVIERRAAGRREVFDLAVDDLHAFVAGTIAVHNCIGNSGPLPTPVSNAIMEGNLVAAAVLSGNRNFEGRVNPHVKANYLASPPLVVAYALAGTVDIDLAREPLGVDQAGQPVLLKDIWPTQKEVSDLMASSIKPEMFQKSYGNVFAGNLQWNAIPVAGGELYQWNETSTYIQHPPFFNDMSLDVPPIKPLSKLRVLAIFGDSVTTDHISPAGNIAENSPAGQYLIAQGVSKLDFNQYGTRRGNDQIMTRGTFANIRIKNLMVPGVEGGVTLHQPTGELTSIYEAAMKYQHAGIYSVVLAGKEYGTGSSRDYAAKGPYLQGVRVVIAESFERIHRSNLVGMGILPLQFQPGQNVESLGLTGQEEIDIVGLNDELQPRQDVIVRVQRADGSVMEFRAIVRIDTPVEVEYYRNGGILHAVLRKLVKEA